MKISFITILVLFNNGLVRCDDCKPLNQCPSLLALYQNQDVLPEMNRAEVNQYLKELQCGFDANALSPKFFCPPIEAPEGNNLKKSMNRCPKCRQTLENGAER